RRAGRAERDRAVPRCRQRPRDAGRGRAGRALAGTAEPGGGPRLNVVATGESVVGTADEEERCRPVPPGMDPAAPCVARVEGPLLRSAVPPPPRGGRPFRGWCNR